MIDEDFDTEGDVATEADFMSDMEVDEFLDRIEDGGGRWSTADWLGDKEEASTLLGGLREVFSALIAQWGLGERFASGFRKGGPGLFSSAIGSCSLPTQARHPVTQQSSFNYFLQSVVLQSSFNYRAHLC